MATEKIIIFDTTLRDGEQAPGATMNIEEKLLIAKNLEKMGVDVIEAGFPVASEGDFLAVNRIANTIKNSTICGLARAKKHDIEITAKALKGATKSRIHTFIATSSIHMEFKLKMSSDKVLEAIKDSVSYARNNCDEVDWSAEDATRSEHDFLFKAIETAIASGATTINIPDTVGYTTPDEYFALISAIKNSVTNIDKAIISAHCHNDLGLAVANSLSALRAGARQIECTINGIGERAGNAALEEIVMAIKTRHDIYNFSSNIDTTMISRISKLVSNITGFVVQPNKAIVGANAFAHESGIHQDGILKNRATYEIMSPQSVGIEKTSLTLGKLSGRSAFKDRLKELGYDLSEQIINESFVRFKDLADKKKEISNEDLVSIIDGSIIENQARYQLIDLEVNCGNNKEAKIFIKIRIDTIIEQISFVSKDGPVDAIFSAIDKIIPHGAKLELYKVEAVTEGTDAQAHVLVRLNQDNRIYSATGADTNVLVASAIAYINCLQKIKNKN
ncbi:MAG: 2-isopropylmalate synthase [Alphaproteobacteria bacterium]|nr:2-isopropylmalate synthase [Alphaproteobacteria bacterium]